MVFEPMRKKLAEKEEKKKN